MAGPSSTLVRYIPPDAVEIERRCEEVPAQETHGRLLIKERVDLPELFEWLQPKSLGKSLHRRFFRRSRRAHVVVKPVNRDRIAIGGYKRGECRDQSPGGAVDDRFLAGVNVVGSWSSTPPLPTRLDLHVEEAFGAGPDQHPSVRLLQGVGMQHRVCRRKASTVVIDKPGQIRAAQLLLSLGYKQKVDG